MFCADKARLLYLSLMKCCDVNFSYGFRNVCSVMTVGGDKLKKYPIIGSNDTSRRCSWAYCNYVLRTFQPCNQSHYDGESIGKHLAAEWYLRPNTYMLLLLINYASTLRESIANHSIVDQAMSGEKFIAVRVEPHII